MKPVARTVHLTKLWHSTGIRRLVSFPRVVFIVNCTRGGGSFASGQPSGVNLYVDYLAFLMS